MPGDEEGLPRKHKKEKSKEEKRALKFLQRVQACVEIARRGERLQSDGNPAVGYAEGIARIGDETEKRTERKWAGYDQIDFLKQIGHWFDSRTLAREYSDEGRKGLPNITDDDVRAFTPALAAAIRVVKERGIKSPEYPDVGMDSIEDLGGSDLGEIPPFEMPTEYEVEARNGEYINASSVDVRADPTSPESEDNLDVNYRMRIGGVIYRCYAHFIRDGVLLSIDDMSDRSITEQAAKTGMSQNLLYVLEAHSGLEPVPIRDLKREEYELIMYVLKRVAK